MNAAAANALYEAERRGVRQIRRARRDLTDGRCAIGVIEDAGLTCASLMAQPMDGCLMCGAKAIASINSTFPLDSEAKIIAHLNDAHRLTFGEIARKLGPDSA